MSSMTIQPIASAITSPRSTNPQLGGRGFRLRSEDSGQVFAYTDGTTNGWFKMERPSVLMENGHVTYLTFAVSDVDKDSQIPANSSHGSKIVVIPFDGVRFDCETGQGSCADGQDAGTDSGGMGGRDGSAADVTIADGGGGHGGSSSGGTSGGVSSGGSSGSGGAGGSGGVGGSGGAGGSGGTVRSVSGGATGNAGGAGGNASSGGAGGASAGGNGAGGASNTMPSAGTGGMAPVVRPGAHLELVARQRNREERRASVRMRL